MLINNRRYRERELSTHYHTCVYLMCAIIVYAIFLYGSSYQLIFNIDYTLKASSLALWLEWSFFLFWLRLLFVEWDFEALELCCEPDKKKIARFCVRNKCERIDNKHPSCFLFYIYLWGLFFWRLVFSNKKRHHDHHHRHDHCIKNRKRCYILNSGAMVCCVYTLVSASLFPPPSCVLLC